MPPWAVGAVLLAANKWLIFVCILFIVYCLLFIVTLNNKPWAVGAAFLAANVLHSSYRIYVNDPHNKDILWNY